MCKKLPLGDLNLGSSLPHSISTCICRVTIAPRVCGSGTTSTSILLDMDKNKDCSQ